MLSITDLLDFIDLDPETVRIVGRATGLGDDDSVESDGGPSEARP